jgi:hypothetical protein
MMSDDTLSVTIVTTVTVVSQVRPCITFFCIPDCTNKKNKKVFKNGFKKKESKRVKKT